LSDCGAVVSQLPAVMFIMYLEVIKDEDF